MTHAAGNEDGGRRRRHRHKALLHGPKDEMNEPTPENQRIAHQSPGNSDNKSRRKVDVPKRKRRAQDRSEERDEVGNFPLSNRNNVARMDDFIGVALCPGFENLGLKGYSSLEALRRDLSVYFGTVTNTSSESIMMMVASTEPPANIPAGGLDNASPKRQRVHQQQRYLQEDIDEDIANNEEQTIITNTDETTAAVPLDTAPTATMVTEPLPALFDHSLSTSFSMSYSMSYPMINPTSNFVSESSMSYSMSYSLNFDAVSVGGESSLDSGDAKEENASYQAESNGGPPLMIDICPNTVFDFGDASADALPPLIINTPIRSPVWITCRNLNAANDNEGCVFTGGKVHFIFNKNDYEGGNSSESIEGDVEGLSPFALEHTVTFMGLTFRQASYASILMNDPQGKILFQDCKWEDNNGMAFMIDGRFNSTDGQEYSSDGTGPTSDELMGTSSTIRPDGVQEVPQTIPDIDNGDFEDTFPTISPIGQENVNNITYGDLSDNHTLSLNFSTTSPLLSSFNESLVDGSGNDEGIGNGTYLSTTNGNNSISTNSDTTETGSTVVQMISSTTPTSGLTTFATATGATTSATVTLSTTVRTMPNIDATSTSASITENPVDVPTTLVSLQTPSVIPPSKSLPEGGRGRSLSHISSPLISGIPASIRSLAVEELPRSIILIKACSFTKNSGDTTIAVKSFFGELSIAEQDPGVLAQNDDVFGRANKSRSAPLAHSIYLTLENTIFSSENVPESVILNDGGRLQSTDCTFINNTAKSMITSRSGTIALSGTNFTSNINTGESGLIIVDSESTLETNEQNCGFAGIANGTAAIANATEGDPSSAPSTTEDGVIGRNLGCMGIFFGDSCLSFEESCLSDADLPLTAHTEEPLEGCHSTWDGLVDAVRENAENEHDFSICPDVILNISASNTSSPVIIDSDFVSIQCGAKGLRSDNCVISGGASHFHLIGSSSGVKLSGLTMISSEGSSIIAAGSEDATLHLNDCEWTSNSGTSAILIHNNVSIDSKSGMFDYTSISSPSGNVSMSVEITDCTFRNNNFLFGTVSNIGGTLTVYRSLFVRNSATGGDIVVTNKGSCKVQESCFDAHTSSGTPGTIFVEEGSLIRVNEKNFGFGNNVGGTCKDIFQETDGTDCLGESICSGVCLDFSESSCTLGTYEGGYLSTTGAPSPAPKKSVTVPVITRDVNDSKNLTPIIVAATVGAFVVFGLVTIIITRRKKEKKRTDPDGSSLNNSNSEGKFSKVKGVFSGCGSMLTAPCRKCKKKSHDTSAYGVDDNGTIIRGFNNHQEDDDNV